MRWQSRCTFYNHRITVMSSIWTIFIPKSIWSRAISWNKIRARISDTLHTQPNTIFQIFFILCIKVEPFKKNKEELFNQKKAILMLVWCGGLGSLFSPHLLDPQVTVINNFFPEVHNENEKIFFWRLINTNWKIKKVIFGRAIIVSKW